MGHSSPTPLLVLPNRPLKIAGKPIASPRFGVLLTLLMLGFGLIFTIWQVPDLWRDAQIKANPIPASDFDFTDGECNTQNLVVTTCDANFSYEVADAAFHSDVDMMFLDFGTDDYLVHVVHAADDPAKATLSLAIDKFWNRLIVWFLGAGLFFALAGLSIFLTFRSRRAMAALRHPSPLKPAKVDIRKVDQRRKFQFITYGLPSKRKWFPSNYFTKFPAGNDPLIFTDNFGKAFGIAVIHTGTKAPVLLDSSLTRIELTTDERTAALAALYESKNAPDGP